MSEQKHTPEPYDHHPRPWTEKDGVITADNGIIVGDICGPESGRKYFVACVNALVGKPDPAQYVKDLETQNAALREALEDLIYQVETPHPGYTVPEWLFLGDARAALAQCKEVSNES